MADKKDDQIVDEKPAEKAPEVTDDELAKLKAEDDAKKEVETPETEADESLEAKDSSQDEPDNQEDESPEDSEVPPPTFTKKFDNIKGETPEEYARNLEIAYDESFKEMRRLREQTSPEQAPAEPAETDPVLRYAQSKMQQEIDEAYTGIVEKYPQVRQPETFEKFYKAVGGVSNAIADAEGRQPGFAETYEKAAQLLGLEANESDPSEKLGSAVKDSAAAPKINSGGKITSTKSKVTDAQVKLGRQMFPGKADAEIRKELEEVKT